MKKELLHKPNQMIMMTNHEVTATQRKAYNIILFEARRELKKNNNQNVFSFKISSLKERSGIKATDNLHLKNDIKALKNIEIETFDDKENWGIFNLISYAGKQGNEIEIELPKPIREALLKNDYYTTLDLLMIKSLTGKYAIIIYEMAIRYSKAEIPKLLVQEFKELTGIENKKSYDNFSNIKIKVIEPAVREINEKTDIVLSYETEKKGKSYTYIKFKIENEYKKIIQIYSKEVEELFLLLPIVEQLEERKNEIENLLKEHSFEFLKADIKYIKNKNSKDFWAYFLKSTKSGHYGAELIAKEKKKKKIEKEQQKTLEEESNKKENLLNNIIENPTKNDIEEFENFYNNMNDKLKKKANREIHFKEFIKLKYSI